MGKYPGGRHIFHNSKGNAETKKYSHYVNFMLRYLQMKQIEY